MNEHTEEENKQPEPVTASIIAFETDEEYEAAEELSLETMIAWFKVVQPEQPPKFFRSLKERKAPMDADRKYALVHSEFWKLVKGHMFGHVTIDENNTLTVHYKKYNPSNSVGTLPKYTLSRELVMSEVLKMQKLAADDAILKASVELIVIAFGIKYADIQMLPTKVVDLLGSAYAITYGDSITPLQ